MSVAIEKKLPSTHEFIRSHAKDFQQVLPSHLSADRMMRLALSALNTTPHLSECTIQSVAMSLMASTALGLEPNTPLGHAYLIPYKKTLSRRGEPYRFEYRCQLIVGYRGYIELFYRSGVVESVQAFPVFEGDRFEVSLGLKPDLVHVPTLSPDRCREDKLTHVYGVIRLKNSDTPIWGYMDRAQIEARKQRSSSIDWKTKEVTGPWVTDYVAMALKTIIRDMHRWVPFSVEKPLPPIAAAYEGALEGGDARKAFLSLGPDVAEASQGLLEGIPEDEEPVIEAETAPASLDTVIAANEAKAAASEQPNKTQQDIQEAKRKQLAETEALRVAVIDRARQTWGDKAMIKLGQLMRGMGTSISDAGIDALNETIDSIANEVL